jgi:hypothetical protein
MSEIAVAKGEAPTAFNRGTMLAIAGAGILAFLAMLVLGAYAPELRGGKNGGSHALSNAATGYSGLVRLVELTGGNPTIVRQDYLLDSAELLVITPENQWVDLSELLERRKGEATLLVLPKWQSERDQKRPSWVRIRGLVGEEVPVGVLAPEHEFEMVRGRTSRPFLAKRQTGPAEMRFRAPRLMQAVKKRGFMSSPIPIS